MTIIEKIKRTFNKRPSHAEVFRGENDKWYFRIVAGNGQITSGSQGYSTKSNAARAVRTFYPQLEVRYV